MPDDLEGNGANLSDAMSDNEIENEYDDDSAVKDEDDTMFDGDESKAGNGNGQNGEAKKKVDPKDPHRPRRKKARRACYACQRAHLTCGKFKSTT